MDPNANSAKGSLDGDDQGQERRYSEEDVSKILSEKIGARVNEVTQNFKSKISDLEAKVNQAPAPRKYTRAELNTAVKEGKIGESEAQSIFDKQQEQDIEERAQQTAERVISQQNQQTKIQSSIDAYTNFDPDLMVEGTDARSRISNEVQAQMSIFGQKEATLATELAALRAVYGPEEGLSKGKEHRRESHQESFGGSDGQSKSSSSGWSKDITSRQRDHYQRMMDMGQITMDQVKDEIKFYDKDVARRAASR